MYADTAAGACGVSAGGPPGGPHAPSLESSALEPLTARPERQGALRPLDGCLDDAAAAVVPPAAAVVVALVAATDAVECLSVPWGPPCRSWGGLCEGHLTNGELQRAVSLPDA
ncbi:hypothetical protein Efla_003837 [Eimeria flavescens]